MKIGILTYHRADNYGAYLQAYALTMKFKSLGFDSELIDFNMEIAEKQYKVKNINPINRYYESVRHKMFTSARGELPLSKDALISDDMDSFKEFVRGKYDIIVAGSDEIWKLNSFRGFPTPYWLIGDLGARKMSYAASSRSDFSRVDNQTINLIRKTLEEYALIGVRDSFTYKELEHIIGNNNKLQLCCDPVFTYSFQIDANKGRELLKKRYGVKKNKPILGVMINDEKLAIEIRKQLGNKFELVSIFRQWRGYHKTADLTPFEWIDVISSLDILVSNYFHGICFAMIGKTNFIAIDSREEKPENGKLYDLLRRNSCLNRFLTTSDEAYISNAIDMCKSSRVDIDFDKIVLLEQSLAEEYFKRLEEILR